MATPKNPRLKRGRPSTGKRSDPSFVTRTYFIRKATDIGTEEALLELKKKTDQALDKSELVEKLLSAWVRWQRGEISHIEEGLDSSPKDP